MLSYSFTFCPFYGSFAFFSAISLLPTAFSFQTSLVSSVYNCLFVPTEYLPAE